MHADHAFVMGQSHKVCQDYALSRVTPDHCVVVVSDGCSGSPDTDVGARLVALSAAKCAWNLSPMGMKIEMTDVVNECKRLRLPLEAADATCLGIYVKDNIVHMWGAGDGFIASKNNIGLSIIELYSETGLPFYPSYHADQMKKRLSQYISEGHWMGAKQRYVQMDFKVECEDIGGIDDGFFSSALYMNADCIAVFSDGVASFTDDNGPISADVVIKELMNFKSTNGQFVQRRMQGFLRSCKALRWRHADDIAMAAVAL